MDCRTALVELDPFFSTDLPGEFVNSSMSASGLTCLREGEIGARMMVRGVETVFAGDEIVTGPVVKSLLFIRDGEGMVPATSARSEEKIRSERSGLGVHSTCSRFVVLRLAEPEDIRDTM
jgi:hypothetical protein